ncbi:hypothetical protein JW926_00785, partial [Candidatus Sumerlaeota bacterium]|nr:hypothetical protein [Candidatus Sumerlaeota bacterium]
YFFPLSGSYVDGRLSALLEKDWSRSADVTGACLYFSRGVVTIRDVAIYPDQGTGDPFHIQGVTIEFSPLSVLFSKPDKWRDIHLDFPGEIPFLLRDSRIIPGDDFKHMVPFIKNALSGASGQREGGISKIHINLDAVSLALPFPSESSASPPPLMKLENLSLVFSFHQGLLGVVASEGTIRSELQGDFRGLLTFHPDGAPDHLMLYFSHVMLSDKSVPFTGFLFDAVHIKIKEKMESMSDCLSLLHDISIDSLSLNAPGVNRIFHENQIQFAGITEFQGSNKFLNLDESRLLIDNSEMILEGGITLSGDYPFSLEMEQFPISPQTINIFRNLLFSTQWDMAFQPNSLALYLEAYGDLKHPKDARLLGSLKFTDVALRHKGYPFPITRLNGLVTLDRSNIVVSGVTGRFGGGDISLEAHISSSDNFSPPENISMTWTANLLIQDILMSLKEHLPIPGGTLTGNILSTGTLEMDLIHTDDFTSLSLKNLGGFVEIQNADLHLDMIPFDIRGVQGRMNVLRNSIESAGLSGTVPDGNIRLQGKIDGESFFWDKPVLSAVFYYGGNLEPLVQSAPAYLKDILESLKAKGSVDIKTRIVLPFLEISRSSYSGSASFSNCSFTPAHPSLQGEFDNINGDIRFVDNAIFGDRVSGQFARMPFNLQGAFVKDHLRFDLDSLIDLAALRTAVPPLSDDFRGTGTVELNCSASIPPSLMKSLLSNAALPEKPELKISGKIRLLDAAFAYRDMPADLHRLYGLIEFSEKGFKYSDVKGWCGESPDCTIDGEINLGQRPLLVRFQVHAPELFFTEWTGPWKSSTPSASDYSAISDLTSTSPTLEVDGALLADKIHFERLEGDSFHAHFIYNYFPSAPNKFSFDDVTVNAYGGKARASGNMLFPSDTFYYGVQGETENIDINPMLTALRGEQDSFTGFLTGTATLAGESGKSESIRSKIKFDVQQSRFISNVILLGLGEALHSSLLDDITFSRIQGEVSIIDNVARFEDISFTSFLVNLNASGTVDLHENVDVLCYIVFERKNIFSLPVFKQIAGILEHMGKAILKFRITGTLNDPKVDAIPLSSDELKKLLPWF